MAPLKFAKFKFQNELLWEILKTWGTKAKEVPCPGFRPWWQETFSCTELPALV